MPLEVSYPPAILNPNARPHWAPKRRAERTYKAEVFHLAKDALRKRLISLPDTRRIGLELDFYPPNNGRARDDDNALSSFKPGRDGLALALDVDDKCFRTTFELHDPDPACKLGKVVIRLTPIR